MSMFSQSNFGFTRTQATGWSFMGMWYKRES